MRFGHLCQGLSFTDNVGEHNVPSEKPLTAFGAVYNADNAASRFSGFADVLLLVGNSESDYSSREGDVGLLSRWSSPSCNDTRDGIGRSSPQLHVRTWTMLQISPPSSVSNSPSSSYKF